MDINLKPSVKLKINLDADRKVLQADGKDISYIITGIFDEQNEIFKDFDHKVNFYVSGNAKIVAIDNNTTHIHSSAITEKTGTCILKGGPATLILQAGLSPEIIAVTAMAVGLTHKTIRIKIKRLCI